MHMYGFSHCSLAVASALPSSCISLLTSKSPMIETEAFSMYSVLMVYSDLSEWYCAQVSMR